MTKKELNRDIRKLYTLYKKEHSSANIKNEVLRLYYADTTLELLSLQSFKMLLRVNLSNLAIPLHRFGLTVKIK